MCTLAILRRPEHDWPVIIGANRDEMIDRPAKPPGRHWADRVEVVAGLDLLAGGDDRQAIFQRPHFDVTGFGMAQPKRIAIVGDDQVEAAIRGGIEM